METWLSLCITTSSIWGCKEELCSWLLWMRISTSSAILSISICSGSVGIMSLGSFLYSFRRPSMSRMRSMCSQKNVQSLESCSRGSTPTAMTARSCRYPDIFTSSGSMTKSHTPGSVLPETLRHWPGRLLRATRKTYRSFRSARQTIRSWEPVQRRRVPGTDLPLCYMKCCKRKSYHFGVSTTTPRTRCPS